MEDELNFGGRGPSVENALWWQMTFGGRQPLVDPSPPCGIFYDLMLYCCFIFCCNWFIREYWLVVVVFLWCHVDSFPDYL